MTINEGDTDPAHERPPTDDGAEPVEPGSDAGPVLAPYHKDAMPTDDPGEGAQL